MSQIQVLHHDSESDWLATRMSHVGASEVPTVLGLNPFQTPLDLWAIKTGKKDPPKTTEAMVLGHRMEQIASDLFAEETGRTVTDPGKYAIFYNPEFADVGASVDRLWASGDDQELAGGILQLKNVGPRMVHKWEDEDGNQVWPEYVDAQIQTEMNCAGTPNGSVAVVLAGSSFLWADVPRKPDAWFDDLKEKVADFMACVRGDLPPEATGKDAKLLAHLYPNAVEGESVALPVEANDWAGDLRRLKAERKSIADAIDVLESRVKSIIGEAEQGVTPDGTVFTWKEQNRKEYTVKAATFRVLRMK